MSYSRQPRSERDPYDGQPASGDQEPGRGRHGARSGILSAIGIRREHDHPGLGARHAERRGGKHRSRAA
jgi:hypothetical protein